MSDRRVLFQVYITLQLLLLATIGVSFLRLGAFNPILNFSIAGAKAALTQLPHFAPCRRWKAAEKLGFRRRFRECGAKI
jgi:hypothetical protein